MSVLVIALAESDGQGRGGVCCIDQTERIEISVAAARAIIAGSVPIRSEVDEDERESCPVARLCVAYAALATRT